MLVKCLLAIEVATQDMLDELPHILEGGFIIIEETLWSATCYQLLQTTDELLLLSIDIL